MTQPIVPKRFPPPPPRTSPSRTPGGSRSTSPPPLHTMIPRRRPSELDSSLTQSGTAVFASTQPPPQHLAEEEEEPAIIFHSKNSAVFASPIQQQHAKQQTSLQAEADLNSSSQHQRESSQEHERRSHTMHRVVVPPQQRPMATQQHAAQRPDNLLEQNDQHQVLVPQRRLELQQPQRENHPTAVLQGGDAPIHPQTSSSTRLQTSASTLPTAAGPIGGPRGHTRVPPSSHPERAPLPNLQPSTSSVSSSNAFGSSTAATEAPAPIIADPKNALPPASWSAPLNPAGRRVPLPSNQLSSGTSGNSSPLASQHQHVIQSIAPASSPTTNTRDGPLVSNSTNHQSGAPSPVNQLLPTPKRVVPHSVFTTPQPEAAQVIPVNSSRGAVDPAPPSFAHQISVVLKGAWAAPTPAGRTSNNLSDRSIPPSRIIEVSAIKSTTVLDAIQQCLSVLDSDRSVQRLQLQVVSAELEQGNRVLSQHALLEEISHVSELYFLLVQYDTRETVVPLLPTASTGSSFDRHSIALLEARLSTLENFVRAKSSPRRDDVDPAKVTAHGSPSTFINGNTRSPPKALPDDFSVPGLSPIQPEGEPTADEMTQLLLSHHAAVAGTKQSRLAPPQVTGGTDVLAPHTLDESYTAKAEKLAFLALASRKERLVKLDEIKCAIARQLDMYQWMSQRSDPAGTASHQQQRQLQDKLSNAVMQQQQQASSSSERLFPPTDVLSSHHQATHRTKHGAGRLQLTPQLPFDVAAGSDLLRRHTDGETPRGGQLNRWTAQPQQQQQQQQQLEAVDHENVHVDYDPILDIWKLRKGPPV
ncbi:Hypothetical protein, putative [Bodo saltans]|uniref:Uncharacterized protein n=1 Tax=Bodo saltans TaxID=75058 RepID=A0A0S4ILB7_BODSA|nr:Hypothetical protein, putative [Bodo saltans]|eukprot:CUE69651.1 Hypothetical protein, putative [Bodo saltans]